MGGSSEGEEDSIKWAAHETSEERIELFKP